MAPVRFEFFTAVNMTITVVWDVTPCSLTGRSQFTKLVVNQKTTI